ncbi:MAG: RMD1 family protein [Pseudomonadota bacterium]|nr:MAG: hypothetical protein DIU78_17280 [Pseudomonadota bacterium]
MESASSAPAETLDRTTHTFYAAAFVEKLSLKELARVFPEASRTARYLRFRVHGGGEVFVYPFGAAVFFDVPSSARDEVLKRLRQARPELTWPTVINEEFSVRSDPEARAGVVDGVLVLDQLTEGRVSVVALTVAQSAAMEYYERIAEEMFARTDRMVHRLEQRGTVAWSTRPLHRFIGAAVGTRNEILSVLHLLDKPDEAWDDPVIDRIYDRLRAEFDLVDRYQAVEMKLRSIQEALELVLDTARDRRLVLLELAIVLLIVFDIVLSFIPGAH